MTECGRFFFSDGQNFNKYDPVVMETKLKFHQNHEHQKMSESEQSDLVCDSKGLKD